ncbi:hypothetical protein A2U01_0099632, partial [Trifolium medium]|nr:hypothetical protein [Trifolium medium]
MVARDAAHLARGAGSIMFILRVAQDLEDWPARGTTRDDNLTHTQWVPTENTHNG